MTSRLGTLLLLGLVAACSMLNREGPDVTCTDLGDGAENACVDGIIASCSGGAVHWRVCDDKKACEQSWQVEGQFRCADSDPIPNAAPTGGSGGGGGGTGAVAGNGGTGAVPETGGSGGTGGTSAASCDQCITNSCADKINACNADAKCSELLTCIKACGDTSCSKACVYKYPDSASYLGYSLRQCVLDNCPKECPTWS